MAMKGSKSKASPDKQVNPYELFEQGLEYLSQQTQESYAKAVPYFKQAANMGLPGAMYNLGLFYMFGNGVEESEKDAIRCFKNAAQFGHMEARIILQRDYSLGPYYMNEDDIEIPHDPEAAYQLGLKYFSGDGVPQDFLNAADCFESAACVDHAPSQFRYACCLIKGFGVEANPYEAFDWAKKAAKAGALGAAYVYGMLLMQGYGEDDEQKGANYWISKDGEAGETATNKAMLILFPEMFW